MHLEIFVKNNYIFENTITIFIKPLKHDTMKKNSLLLISGLLIILLFSPGCATLFGGKYNTLVLDSENQLPAKVYIDSVYVGDVPGKLKLEKKVIQHGSKLEIKADGYETEKHILVRKLHPIYTIADVFTLGLGLAVDYATGSIYRPIPRKFNYKLEKVN